MISVCIPIYNLDVRQLVTDLLSLFDERVEIILIDDRSRDEIRQINSDLHALDVTYIELKENIGRSKIRNLFLNYANNPFLLFLDCDAKIIDREYIINYLNAITSSTDIIFGGSVYTKVQPEGKYMLRWKNGRQRESKSAAQRQLNPNKSFMTNNFLISTHVLNRFPFDERITKYGHEDTLLGIVLEKNGIAIEHIENPVENFDLDTNEVFISKTEDALDNLLEIVKYYDDVPALENSIAILRLGHKINRYKLTWLFACWYKIVGKSLRDYLQNSEDPSLKLFMVYKLIYLMHLQQLKK